ncbi:hypothetical protein V8J82_11865 [Gymnodinialimonas sp. 2305UL16-5]|uniref:hypothetical protein n=1 Tax=Gymnodinialimonas mytili TaxID=3126503 RepID=UPI0030971942
MDPTRYASLTDELREMIATRLGVRARSFPHAVRKARPMLSHHGWQAAQHLIAMEDQLRHPKLSRHMANDDVEAAANAVKRAVARHRPGVQIGRRRSLLAAEIGFRILLVVGAGLALVYLLGTT